jgi:N-acyl-D-amino-acid deacylase
MYDLLIKSGRFVDGSGMPSFNADVGIRDGVIVDIGRLSGEARRTIDASGRVVAPGFIDNHCHFDAQVTWDPLCTFSPQHGVTSVIFGNCSLSLAPARPDERESLAKMLSRVEAIPMESLRAGVNWQWETFPEYLDFLDRKLGVNAGVLMGHSAIRRYVMGTESQERAEATPGELAQMQEIIRDGMRAGALGLSFDRNGGHLDLEGKPVPAIVAPLQEIYALASALADLPAGVLQCGSAYPLEIREGFATHLSQVSGRPVVYNQLVHNAKRPDQWREHLDLVAQRIGEGWPVYPVVNPRPASQRFTMRNAQMFDRMPTWREVMLTDHETKKSAFADPAMRATLRAEAVEGRDLPVDALPIQWDRIRITRVLSERYARYRGKSVGLMAREENADVLDAFLDMVLADDLNTGLENNQSGSDAGALAAMLASPYSVIGLSDAGAHVIYEAGYGYATLLLGHWVREEKALSLEEAIRKLTSMQAALYGLDGRGLLRRGYAADVVVFDPDTVGTEEPEEVHDLPGGLMRLGQRARGVDYTVVNGQVLYEHGEHTGAYPGRVLRNGAAEGARA